MLHRVRVQGCKHETASRPDARGYESHLAVVPKDMQANSGTALKLTSVARAGEGGCGTPPFIAIYPKPSWSKKCKP